ncbi:MAG: ribosomal L7Ae/L30e/S12e/Gadd45 family protein [Acholeplasma sp.]|nr:ribosomal L7Ae/L30e/S12e/Gadd45 family protein [Acholeplasma sp.]
MPNRIGLAFVAGKVKAGTDMAIEAIRNKSAKLVFLASDASENTRKKVKDKALFYGVEVLELFDTKTLSKAVGKTNIKALAILDQGFSNMFKK